VARELQHVGSTEPSLPCMYSLPTHTTKQRSPTTIQGKPATNTPEQNTWSLPAQHVPAVPACCTSTTFSACTAQHSLLRSARAATYAIIFSASRIESRKVSITHFHHTQVTDRVSDMFEAAAFCHETAATIYLEPGCVQEVS
jgi:hypothetical protein